MTMLTQEVYATEGQQEQSRAGSREVSGCGRHGVRAIRRPPPRARGLDDRTG